MAEAIGANIDINALSQAIKNADKGLEDLQKTSDKVTKSINKAFESVAQGGIQQLSQSIEALNKGLQNLGKSSGSKGVTRAMEEISKSTDNVVDKVNRMATLMQTISDGGRGKTKNGQIENLNYQIEESMKRLNVLRQKMNFYTKGEGRKALDANVAPDMTKTMQEANALRVKIDLLQREREHLQANAALKERSGAIVRQQGRDTEWSRMEQEKRETQRRNEESRKQQELEANRAISKERIEQLAREREQRERTEKLIANTQKQNYAQKERELNDLFRNSTKGAIGYGSDARNSLRSVSTLKDAISQMERAQNSVNTSTKAGRKEFFELSKEILKSKAELAKLSGQAMQTNSALSSVGRAIVSAFSFQAIRGYVNKMIDVRKELERQNKALQIIVGNKEQANRIWDQTIELAVKSPFTIQELTRYTRQLAAYRIETSKLYETNKMLADVSAGLGVDMQRLILAYGQIRAASFLRGTELRQLTEAGVPMLEELSKHFTELYGRVVTVDEAFAMVSKRQVAFKDVEQVFKNMTSEGGVFFNMQEQMSNTLHGKISNLKDSITIMLNEIGMSNEGTIHSTLDVIKKLVDNWRLVAAAIKTVIIAYGSYQGIATIAAIVTGRFGMAVNATIAGETAALASTNRLTRGLARLIAAFRGGAVAAGGMSKAMGFLSVGLPTLIISAVAAIAMFSKASKEASAEDKRRQEEMEQNIEQLRKKNETLIRTINKLRDAYNSAVDSNNIIDQRIQLQKLIDMANEEYKMKISVEVDRLGEEKIKSTIDEISSEMMKISRYATGFGEVLETAMPNFTKNAKDFTQDFSFVFTHATSVQSWGKNLGLDLDFTYDETKSIIENLEAMSRQLPAVWGPESTYEDKNAYKNLFVLSQRIRSAIESYRGIVSEAKKATTHLGIRSAKDEGLLDEALSLTIDQFISQKDVSFEAGNVLSEFFNSFYNLDIEKAKGASLHDWQKRFNDYLVEIRKESEEALKKEFGGNTNLWADSGFDAYGALLTLPMFDEKNYDKTRDKMKEMIEGQIESSKKIIDTFEKGIGDAGAYTENEYKFAKIEYEQLKKALEFFGGKEDKSAKKRLQDQIKLLEEMHKKYLELKKTFGDEKAESEVKKAYSDTFAEVFKDTGISFDAYKTFGGFVNVAGEAGAEAGTALTEEMQAKIDELTEKGVYIRNYTKDLIEATKKREGFVGRAYDDMQPDKILKEGDKILGTLTKGYGTTNNAGLGNIVKIGDIISEQEAEELLIKTYDEKVDSLNTILDLHKELIITQEQYNELLDAFYQGEAGTKKAIDLAVGEWSAFESYLNAIKDLPQLNKKHLIIDVDSLKAEWEALDTYQEKLALALKWTNITTKKDGQRYLSSAMQKRSAERSAVFSGDLDIAKQLEDALVTMDSLDFMTKEGMVAALSRLKELAKKAGPEVEKLLSKTISGYEAEIGVKIAQDADKQLQTDVQDLFDRHSLTIELKKLQVPPTVAKNLFGIDFLDDAGLKSEVIETYTKKLTGETKTAVANELAKGVKGANWALVAKKLGDEQIDQIKKDIEKVDDLEEKALKERMKKYVEYSRKSLEGAGKIRLEQLQKMMDIEETFKPKDGDTDEVKATKAEEKARALNRAAEEANEAIMKLQWEEFRKSETFTSLFDDLDTASDKVLEDVIARLEKFKEQWKDLPIDQMKEVDALLRKAKRAKDTDDSPWSYARGLRRSIKKDGRTIDEATIASATAEQEKARLEEELRMMELIQQQRNLNTSEEQLEIVLGEKYKHLLKETLDLDKQRGEIAKQQGIIDSAQDRIQDQKDLIKAYEKQNKALQEMDEMAQDLYGSFKELYEAMGQDEAWATFADAGMEMTSMVLNTMALQAELNAAKTSAEGFGLAMNTAMGAIGWIVMGVQILTKVITAIAEYEDKLIEQEVEKQTRAVNEAIEAYERLEEAIGDAYSTEQIRAFSKQMDDELQKAIDAQKAIIEARRSAKHSSEEGHEDWEALKEAEDALDELNKRAEENAKNIFSTLTDGILDSVYDAAREFTDAWHEAFKETGDGLSGLEENFDEMFLNLAKSQAAQQITGTYVKMWQDELKKVINPEEGDTSLSPEEAAEWAEKVKATFPELSAALEGFLGVISEGLGERGGLSELQKGIQGVTEQTAQVLEALLNSMRDTQANAYQELQKQTRILGEIRDTLNAVSGNGPLAFSVRM